MATPLTRQRNGGSAPQNVDHWYVAAIVAVAAASALLLVLHRM